MTKTSTKPCKRQVRLAPWSEKLLAVRRVLNGESKAHVRRTSGIPEATLRGWCKSKELVEEAKHADTPNSYNKTEAYSQNGANFCGTTWSSNGFISGDELANRFYKNRTGSESETDSGVTDMSDASMNSNDSSINKTKRAPKRKRIQTESTDTDDVPAAKRRVANAGEKATSSSSSENQRVDDLESRNAKDLAYELLARDIVTRDVFVYLWEELKSLEF